MKKTIIINIGNSIIHIEEDAYEILTAYLNEIKQHFAKSVDDFEIVTDIENRIAEMFAEILLASQVQVITLLNVENVIVQMGRVQDFETEEAEEPIAQKYSEDTAIKKLFRDTDDAVIAGVCSGLGHYLNIEARWIRLIALCCVFFAGAGVLVYIILWIAIPRAVTRSERMEMMGESTNLYGYKRNFEEELASFKDQIDPMVKRSGNFVTEIIGAIGRMLNALGRSLSKLLAGIIVVCGIVFLIGLIICLALVLGFWDTDTYQNFPLSIINEDYRSAITFAAFVILFVPILALVLFSIRVAFNKAAINKSLSFGLLIFWLAGVSIGAYFTAKISSEFKEHAEIVQSTNLLPFNTYVLDANQGMPLSREDSINYQVDQGGFENRVILDDDDDHPFRMPKNVHIAIEKSETGKPVIVQNYEAQGKTFNIALQNAKNIDYKFTQQQGTLTFNPRTLLKNDGNWRNQEVHLTLKVPVGTRLMINNNIYGLLYFYHYNCDAEDTQNGDYKEWIMTDDGLKCKAELNLPATKP